MVIKIDTQRTIFDLYYEISVLTQALEEKQAELFAAYAIALLDTEQLQKFEYLLTEVCGAIRLYFNDHDAIAELTGGRTLPQNRDSMSVGDNIMFYYTASNGSYFSGTYQSIKDFIRKHNLTFTVEVGLAEQKEKFDKLAEKAQKLREYFNDGQ